jgi:hypothetical protein
MSDRVHLDDLARPRFTDEANEIRGAMSSMVPQSPLTLTGLHHMASEQTGLADFGPRDYEERLRTLLDALTESGELNATGQVTLFGQLLQLLKNRLLLNDLLASHPEIHDIELAPPVVIVGLPRTGTTHLHNLLAAGRAFRTLPYWESLEPFPSPAEIGLAPDPRRLRAEQGLWFVDLALPYFKRMHEMTVDHVHEEIQLLANDFSTMFFETLAEVPAWRDYYLDHDQVPHYTYLRTQLQALQHLRGARRWLLKSPQHLEQLPVLTRVFPGVTVLVTHRDPATVVVSMATMVAYTARIHRDRVPVEQIGLYWRDRIALMLESLMRDHDQLPPERSLDIRFGEFMADDLGTAQRSFEVASEALTLDDLAAMRTYLSTHERDRHGSIDYRPEDVGLDREDLEDRFATYNERFLQG